MAADGAPSAAGRPIRVLVVDDDELICSALASILSVEDDIEVVGTGGDGAAVPALVADLGPDVVLMDVRMPAVDGITATRHLTARADAPAVVVITTFENDDHVHDALLAGARGFVLKRASPQTLLAAVRTVAHTDSLVFPAAIRRVAVTRPATTPPRWVGRLTAREHDVLVAVADGMTNAEIAETLSVSTETVKTHLRSLLHKSNSRHRTELVVRAYQAGLLS